MTRSLVSLVLAGALLLIAAACGLQSTSDPIPATAEKSGVDPAAADDAAAQGLETGSKPVVTVSLSPT